MMQCCFQHDFVQIPSLPFLLVQSIRGSPIHYVQGAIFCHMTINNLNISVVFHIWHWYCAFCYIVDIPQSEMATGLNLLLLRRFKGSMVVCRGSKLILLIMMVSVQNFFCGVSRFCLQTYSGTIPYVLPLICFCLFAFLFFLLL